MASVSVRECIRVCRRSVRHINWQTGTAVSEVDTSNLLLQKQMPPPECASLISNLVLISSCCPLRRIRWQVLFEETFFPSPSLHLSLSILHLSLWLWFSAVQNKDLGVEREWEEVATWFQFENNVNVKGGSYNIITAIVMIGNTLSVNVIGWLLCFQWRKCKCRCLAFLSVSKTGT